MSFIKYIKDCIHFAKIYPFMHKGIKRIWLRNILYINAQPKYWHGRLISKILKKTSRKHTCKRQQRRKRKNRREE